ncbi:MAG TPA: hypothetical protein P5348_09765, partial [Bacteroidales bacterium]|nr:hypothetical protein [Bacteroidales bacterium]
MSDLEIKEVRSRRELRDFIYLPGMVHKNDKKWLPPLYADEWALYNPKKNKSFKHTDTVLYVAYSQGR